MAIINGNQKVSVHACSFVLLNCFPGHWSSDQKFPGHWSSDQEFPGHWSSDQNKKFPHYSPPFFIMNSCYGSGRSRNFERGFPLPGSRSQMQGFGAQPPDAE